MARRRRKSEQTRAAGPASTPATALEPNEPEKAVAPAVATPMPRRRKLLVGAALFVGSLLLYLASGKTIPFALGGDSIPNRLIPFSVIQYGTITMDPFAASFAARGGYRWYVQERLGHLVSFYPIGTPLVAIPFFLPAYAYATATGRSSAEDLFAISEPAEVFAASAMTSLTVLLLWLALLRRTSWRRATFTAAVAACCSLLWPVSSQTLWQHTAGAMLLAVVMLVASPPERRQRPFLIGLLLGLCFLVRPQSVLFAVGAAAGLALTAWERPAVERLKTLAPFAAAFAILAIPAVLYNQHFYGNWVGGYAIASDILGEASKSVFEGMCGLLFSPNRGLFVLMPVAAVGVAGAWRLLQYPRRDPVLAGLLVGGFLYFVFHAATKTWAGGWCFGPRYLTETMPLLAVASTLAMVRPGRLGLGVLSVALAWSFLMMFAGSVFFPASDWNMRMEPDLQRASWNGEHFMPWEDFKSWRYARSVARGGGP